LSRARDKTRTAATRPSHERLEKKRVRDPQRARARILECAQRIFYRDGYFATNSNAIAREAGYAPGTFYTHFANKLEVFLAVYEVWVADEWRTIGAAMRSSAAARFESVIARIVAHHRQSSVMRRSLRALAALEPAARNAQNALRKQQISWLQELCLAEGWPRPSGAVCVIVIVALERVLDAIAEGDVQTLGVDEHAARSELARWVFALLTAGPEDTAAQGREAGRSDR
jgi:AcrR family transcriptional regulator